MSITVVGSVAYDSIETPAGRRERCLGGAATYFSLAASFFAGVRVIAVVGEDFGPEQEAVFTTKNIDTRGIEHTAGKSFFWEGSYLENLNEAQTRNTELNVFASFEHLEQGWPMILDPIVHGVAGHQLYPGQPQANAALQHRIDVGQE